MGLVGRGFKGGEGPGDVIPLYPLFVLMSVVGQRKVGKQSSGVRSVPFARVRLQFKQSRKWTFTTMSLPFSN